MATSTTTVVPDVSTSDATFRTWASYIAARLAALGLVKETVTGEINLTTVTKPNGDMMGEGDWKGFQIWRLNDALQATAPFFMKIQYGGAGYWEDWEYGGGGAYPGLKVSFGTGYSSGSLAGNYSEERIIQLAYATAPRKYFWSGASNRFSACFSPEFAYGWGWLAFERTYGSDGNDNGDGLVVAGGSSGQHPRWQMVIPSSGAVPTPETDYGCVAPSTGSGVYGTEVALYRITPFKGKTLRPMRGAFAYFNADVTSESIVTASVDGANMSVLACGNNTYPIARNNNSTRLAIRFE